MSFSEKTIKLVIDDSFLELDIKKYTKWDFEKYPHAVIFGPTGSGKTYLVKLVLGRLAKNISGVELVICDYKSDKDFSFLNNANNFYRFDECEQGLNYVLQKLQKRQLGEDESRHAIFLMFDEWSSYINNLEKKVSEIEKKKLATLLMLGRSFNIHVIISQQRLDASYFNASRDNFSLVIGMGRLSKESIEMMFSDFKDEIQKDKDRGEGTMLIGNNLKNIIVPQIKDINMLNNIIKSLRCFDIQ